MDDAHQQASSPTSVHSVFIYLTKGDLSCVLYACEKSTVLHHNEARVFVSVAAGILYLTGKVDFSASSNSFICGLVSKSDVKIHFFQRM